MPAAEAAPAPLTRQESPDEIEEVEIEEVEIEEVEVEVEEVHPHDYNLSKQHFDELATAYIAEISREIQRCIDLHKSTCDAWAAQKIYHDAFDRINAVQRFIDNVREGSFDEAASYGPFARLHRHQKEQLDVLKRHIFGTAYLQRQAREISSLYGTQKHCPHCREAYYREAGCDHVRCGYLHWISGDDCMRPSPKGRNGEVFGCGRRFDWSVAPAVQNNELDNFFSSVKPVCTSKQVDNWYYGTSWEAAQALQANDFKELQANGFKESDGCLGRAFYFGSKDTASRLARKHDNPAVVVVSLSFTSPKFVEGDCNTWQNEGHDACHTSSTLELCVKDPNLVQFITIEKLETDKPEPEKAPAPAILPAILPDQFVISSYHQVGDMDLKANIQKRYTDDAVYNDVWRAAPCIKKGGS